LILCLDTLGQDRLFSFEEQHYIFQVAKTLSKSWEELEKNLLLKSRDIRLEMSKKEAEYKKQVILFLTSFSIPMRLT